MEGKDRSKKEEDGCKEKGGREREKIRRVDGKEDRKDE